MYIVISIIIFGLLIAIHEFGHYIAAKSFGVRVNEFSVGMGPVIWKKQGEETLYALRAIPIGGFCAMEGEDDDSQSERSLTAKPVWQRLIIFAAGAAMNFVAGAIVLAVLFSTATGLYTTTIDGFIEGFPLEGEDGLMVGDTIYSINGDRVYQRNNIELLMSLAGGEPVDMVVIRDGEKVKLDDLDLVLREYPGQDGLKYGLTMGVNDSPTFWEKLKLSWDVTRDYTRQLVLTVKMFMAGEAGLNDVSSVVGVVGIMNEVGNASETVAVAAQNLANIAGLIAVNLAVMNLLPIPGLDGGRIFLMLVTTAGEKITRRKFDPKYEGYINTVGIILLFGFMIFIVFNDIVKLISG